MRPPYFLGAWVVVGKVTSSGMLSSFGICAGWLAGTWLVGLHGWHIMGGTCTWRWDIQGRGANLDPFHGLGVTEGCIYTGTPGVDGRVFQVALD